LGHIFWQAKILKHFSEDASVIERKISSSRIDMRIDFETTLSQHYKKNHFKIKLVLIYI